MKSLATLSIIFACIGLCALAADDAPFKRGDANADGKVDIADPVWILNALFNGGTAPTCADAADANDDGKVSSDDAVYLVDYLFLHMAAPAAPFPACGVDPTADVLGCAEFAGCQ